MRLKITHRFEYGSDQATPYALQRLRLVPASSAMQNVRSWTLAIEGAREEVRFTDHFGNDTRLISIEGGPHAISIEASGEVETVNRSGVAGAHRGFAPLWLFLCETPLTVADESIEALTATIQRGADIGRLHELMAAVHKRFTALADARPSPVQSQSQEGASQEQDATGAATPDTSNGRAVDHTHMFIAAARMLGFPSRFINGYLIADDGGEHATRHSWAEAHVERLGWVGFDVVNKICPEENYVRVATGRDQREAQAISGIPAGQGAEQLAVRISVEQ